MVFFVLLKLWIFERLLTRKANNLYKSLSREKARGFQNTPEHIECERIYKYVMAELSRARRVLVDYGWRKEV